MTKWLKVFFPLILIVSLVILIAGILLLINFNRRKTSSQDNTNLNQESTFPENEKSGLPDDFPVYPEAILETSYTTEGDKKATSIVWKTDDSISEVASFYKNELTSVGWSVTSNVESEDSVTYSIEKDYKFGLIGIGKGERGVTIISVTIGLRNY